MLAGIICHEQQKSAGKEKIAVALKKNLMFLKYKFNHCSNYFTSVNFRLMFSEAKSFIQKHSFP